MGQFAKDVRRGKISGPNQRGFSRTYWQAQHDEDSLDEEDKRLLFAGLFFDDLLSFLRKEKGISEIALTPDAITRLVIAIATLNLFRIHEESDLKRLKGDAPATMVMSQVMERTVKLQNGQQFTPDELMTGAGDGLKHMLRELLVANATPSQLTEYQADASSVRFPLFFVCQPIGIMPPISVHAEC
jgi:hypothetical protein